MHERGGSRREPFLFGVDFELSEGFFVSDRWDSKRFFSRPGVSLIPR